jgi:thiol reductant ABC exporter CydD subunit
VKLQLRSRLTQHALRLGPGWLTGERSGELATLSTRGVDALDGYLARYLPQLVLAGLVPAVVVVWVWRLDLLSGLTLAMTLPLIPVFMALVGLAARRNMTRQWRALSRLSGHFLDAVAGLPTLKIFGRAAAQAESIRSVTGDYARATMRTLRVSFLSALVLELISALAVALVAVSVGLRLLGGELGLTTALTVLILAPEAYWPLRQLGVHYHESVEGLTAAQRVFEVLETPVPVPGGSSAVPDLAGAAVRVADLSVHFPGRDEPALAGASLAVEPGAVVALTGPSGCGKSTLVGALLGFVAPSGGRVVVGGVDLARLDLDAWRRQVAYLPQHPTLFAGTVADNVRLGVPAAGDDEVRRALHEACAGFVDDLPGGIDAQLGEHGVGLSAGQRQRIALARALLRDAPVLLLDEPTSALDADTEASVVQALRRHVAGRTVVVVSHRPAVLDLADRVVRLERSPALHGAELPDSVPVPA